MNTAQGLTTSEAREILASSGPNEIAQKAGQSPLTIFLEQFKSILVILLILAAVASFFLGDRLDALFIIVIVVLNAILGFVQEYKAEKAIAALKKMTVSLVRVRRDGKELQIDSRYLVPGDIIYLEEGNRIPADARILDNLHFQVNEAALTGESLPVEKDPDDSNLCMLYMGTTVTGGRATAIVTATGMNTKFGKIASSLSEIEDEETPLSKKLNSLGKLLGVLALVASSIVFILGFVRGFELVEMVLTSISLAVAAVPEGLPAVVTITLAVGMQRMAKQHAILRKLSAVEALGSATVIATDKTGTLTKNEMRVVKIWMNNQTVTPENTQQFKNDETWEKIVWTSILCNNAKIVEVDGKETILGDTTEGALLRLSTDTLAKEIKNHGELIEEFAFDAVLKRMSVVWDLSALKDRKKGYFVFSKGSPESILSLSTSVQEKDKVVSLPSERKKQIEKAFQEYAKDGLRVLALAYKQVGKTNKISRNDAEEDLIFLGFVGIEDPPRIEVREAILKARLAGIRTIMVTGDNDLTARSIASQLGLLEDGNEILLGSEFEHLSDTDISARLDRIKILARATPEDKLRIVKLLQHHGNIVAVTGDGVNDALALKQADIGIAMGITGTDVAKGVSDMIITDDNYATIVKAVAEGRTIYDNIKASVKYLIGCNVGEVLAVTVGMFAGWPIILTPIQLLYINLATDGLPAIAMAVEPKRYDIMDTKPPTTKQMFQKRDIKWFIETSTLTAITTVAAFYIGMVTSGIDLARTLGFTTLILVQLFILLDVWIRDKNIHQSLSTFKNKFFIAAFIFPFIVHPFLLWTPLSSIFKVIPITLTHTAIIFALGSILLISAELRKYMKLHG